MITAYAYELAQHLVAQIKDEKNRHEVTDDALMRLRPKDTHLLSGEERLALHEFEREFRARVEKEAVTIYEDDFSDLAMRRAESGYGEKPPTASRSEGVGMEAAPHFLTPLSTLVSVFFLFFQFVKCMISNDYNWL